MTSILVEHAQYVDNAGIPLTGGEVYIGTNGADPVATSGVTVIYSDRELTVPISNPQTLGSDGRSTNKIWASGKYSIQVNNSAAVQFFQDLDAGSGASTENASLFVTGVIGNDAITGETADPISAYSANQQYVFETVGENTGPVTLNVDGVGALAVVKNNSQPLDRGDFADNQSVSVMYNETANNLVWLGQKNLVVDFYQGADVAAATDLLVLRDGNLFDITGNTNIATIEAAADDWAVGSTIRVKFLGTPTLINSASLALIGGANITVAVGDFADFTKTASSVWDMSGFTGRGAFESPLLHVRDEKTSGTDGGTFTSGAWQTRVLNSTLTNEISGASLSTNQITLPAGTYYIDAMAPANSIIAHKVKLYNITDAADELVGWSGVSGSSDNVTNFIRVSGRFTISGIKVFEIQHRCAVTKTVDGFGVASSLATEVYTEVQIWKVG